MGYQQQQNVWYTSQAPRRRPFGVILMSIFLFLQGLFMMLSGIFGLLGLVVLIFDLSKGGALLTHGFISFCLGILAIIFSIGLLLLKRWAFWGTVFVAIFNLIQAVVILFQTNFGSWGQLFVVAFSVIILLYFLLDAQVRAAFRTL
jgi:hypothetical protein